MKKTLQSIGLLLGLATSTTSYAQIPDYGIYPGGLVLESYVPNTTTASYTMGTWDIDSILDSGTPVLLDLFATWCSPCWNYHSGHTLQSLYASTGWGGTGDVAIFTVESDPSTAPGLLETSGLGNWITGINYPMVSHDGVAAMMNLRYYPTVILICPDRTVTEVGQASESGHIAAINACAGLATNGNDPRIVAETTISQIFSCSSTASNVDISVAVQNYSTNAINGMYTFEAYDASNNVIATVNASLNLAPYAATEVIVGSVSPIVGNNVYSVKITTSNDDLTNDEITGIDIMNTAAQTMPIENGVVNLSLLTDNYASEVGIVFDAGLPPSNNLIAIHNAQAGNQTAIGFTQVGSLPNNTNSHSFTYNISANGGCHYFMFVDSQGDGIDYQTSGTGATITTAVGGNMFVAGNWGSGGFTVIEFEDCDHSTATIDYELCINNPSITLADGTIILVNSDNIGTVGGTYFATITKPDYCDSVITYNITECVALSVGDLNGLSQNVSIYPNPTNNTANITFAVNETSNVSIELVNTLGQLIFTNNLGEVNGENKFEIDGSNLEEGIYFVNVIVNGQVNTKRLSVIK